MFKKVWLEHILIKEEQQGTKLERRPKRAASHSNWGPLWISGCIYQYRRLEERQERKFIWDLMQRNAQRKEREGWCVIINTAG